MFWNRVFLIRPSFEKSFGSNESSNTKFLNKQNIKKTQPQQKSYTKLSHPLKLPNKNTFLSVHFCFQKKDINSLTPQQLLHLSTPCRSSRSLLPFVINASRREGIPCRYVGSCPHSPLGWSSNTTVVSEEIGRIPWRSGGASVGVGRGIFPEKGR